MIPVSGSLLDDRCGAGERFAPPAPGDGLRLCGPRHGPMVRFVPARPAGPAGCGPMAAIRLAGPARLRRETGPRAQPSARAAASTSAAWPFTFTLGQTRTIRPVPSARKVARAMPI